MQEKKWFAKVLEIVEPAREVFTCGMIVYSNFLHIVSACNEINESTTAAR